MATGIKKRAVKKPQAASIVWFEVPADDLGRAKTFYGSLFGWSFAKIPAAIDDYWHIDTGGKDATPDGGLMPRMHPKQSITNYVGVPSVTVAMKKVDKLGERCARQRRRCRAWVISQSVRTRRAIRLPCGR